MSDTTGAQFYVTFGLRQRGILGPYATQAEAESNVPRGVALVAELVDLANAERAERGMAPTALDRFGPFGTASIETVPATLYGR